MARAPRHPRPTTGRLFPAAELRLRPTGEARLRVLARAAPRRLPSRASRADEDHRAMQRLREIAEVLVPRFGLRYASIEAEADGVVGHYGICYHDGVIRIRLRHATTGRLLKESSLVDTLCHELAHLRHFDHSVRFRSLYAGILGEARRRGLYRPGPATKPGPVQTALFEGCGVRSAARRGRERR